MKLRNLILIAISGFSCTLFAQTEKPVDSNISNVTVFLAKAQVTREAKTRIEAGKTSLIIKGLPSVLDPQSIQVAGKGNFIILGTSHRQNFLSDLNLPKGLKVVKDSIEFYKKQISLSQNQKGILTIEEQLLLSNQKIGGNQTVTALELKNMADFYRTRFTEIANAQIKEDDKIKVFTAKQVRLQSQFDSQNEMYSRNTSEIVVNVSAEAASSADLTINYVVANAGWYPVYDVRAINTKNPLQLSYKANVFQSTGEEWKNVHLTLSTTNPELGGLKPELSAWYLNFYVPVVYSYRKSKTAKYADAPAPAAGAIAVEEDKEADASSVSDYVQTVQTSLNTEFNISLPYTIASSNQPTSVDIRSYEMKGDYQYSVVPKLDMDAFLIAKATGWEEYNLLPGEANIFFEGTFVGKTFIDPNSVKDTLSISLGRDKRIVVKREKVKDFSSRKMIGTNVREGSAFELSVRNTKQEAITIVVEDQVPVSQNSQIEVTMIDNGGAAYNKETGKLTWTWTLQPNETKKTTFKFEVKYPKDRQVGGL